jgi:hypothetical protein
VLARSRSASKSVRGYRKDSALRLLVTFFALFAFSLQTYIGQTHIHLAPDSLAAIGAHKQAPDKFPANGDPANCPICQEVLHDGQFVTPAAAMLLPPSLAASIVEIAAPLRRLVQAASHAWRSRAPPAA